MDDVKKKLVEKVLKLFTLGDTSRNQSEAEAEAAATKARQLMLEHALTQADLESYGTDKAKRVATIIQESSAYTLKRRSFAIYDQAVANAVDAICDTKNYSKTLYSGGEIYVSRMFIGTDVDVAVATRLFQVLMNTMKQSARDHVGTGWNKRHSSYSLGWAVRISQRAKDAKLAHLTDGQTHTLAMALRGKGDAVNSYAEKIGLIQKKSRRPKVTADYYAGYADGGNVDLGGPKRRLE